MKVMLHCAGMVLLALVVLVTLPAPIGAQSTTPPAARDEFVPLDELPPGEEVPAGALVVAAYSVVWVLFVGYVWHVSRRLTHVQREIDEVRRHQARARTSGPSA